MVPEMTQIFLEMIPEMCPIFFGNGTRKVADFFVWGGSAGDGADFFADFFKPRKFSIKTKENNVFYVGQKNRHKNRHGFLEVFLQTGRVGGFGRFSLRFLLRTRLLVECGVPPPP